MIAPRHWLSSLPPQLQSAIAAVYTAFFATAAASGLVNLLMLVGPVFMLQTYDRVLPSRSISTLVGLALIALVLLMVQAIVDLLRSRPGERRTSLHWMLRGTVDGYRRRMGPPPVGADRSPTTQPRHALEQWVRERRPRP